MTVEQLAKILNQMIIEGKGHYEIVTDYIYDFNDYKIDDFSEELMLEINPYWE